MKINMSCHSKALLTQLVPCSSLFSNVPLFNKTTRHLHFTLVVPRTVRLDHSYFKMLKNKSKCALVLLLSLIFFLILNYAFIEVEEIQVSLNYPFDIGQFTEICDENLVNISTPCLCYKTGTSTNSLRCGLTFLFVGGRLGNQISVLAISYVLGRQYHRPVHLDPKIGKLLKEYFKPTIPVMTEDMYHFLPWNFKNFDVLSVNPVSDAKGLFLQFFGIANVIEYYFRYEDEIRRLLTLSEKITARAQQALQHLGGDKTYIGVHVRRGDWLSMNKDLYYFQDAYKSFLAEATEYFRSRYSNVMFVVASSDIAWCRENINSDKGDVHFLENGNEEDPIHDFAILANCNHSIYTVGTFGFFASFLAGGEVVFMAKLSDQEVAQAIHYGMNPKFPSNWHPFNITHTKLKAEE